MDSVGILSPGGTARGAGRRACVQEVRSICTEQGQRTEDQPEGGRGTDKALGEREERTGSRRGSVRTGDHLPRMETGQDGSGRTPGGKSGALFCPVAFKMLRGIQAETPSRQLYERVWSEADARRAVRTEA